MSLRLVVSGSLKYVQMEPFSPGAGREYRPSSSSQSRSQPSAFPDEVMLGGERVDVVPQVNEGTLGKGLREHERLHCRVFSPLAGGRHE